MKLQVAVVGLLLPVLFSTTNSPSRIYQMAEASPIARRSRWCIQSLVVSCLDPHGSLLVPSMNHTTIKLLSDLLQVVSCLDPHNSLLVPSMNHTTIKLLSDLLQLTDQPIMAAKVMEYS